VANLELLKVDPVDAAFHHCSNPHTHARRNIGTRLDRRTTELEQSRRFRVERDRWLARDRNLFLAAYRPLFLARGAVPLEDYPLALNHVLETHSSDAATTLASTRNLQRNGGVGHGWDKREPNVSTRNSVLREMARLRFRWMVRGRTIGVKCDFLPVWERASVDAASENRCTTDIGSRHRGSPDSVGEAVAIARQTSGHRLVRVRGRDNSQHRAPTSTNRSVIREYTAAQSARFRASQSAMKCAVVFGIDAHF
jgi:hypothetical protein